MAESPEAPAAAASGDVAPAPKAASVGQRVRNSTALKVALSAGLVASVAAVVDWRNAASMLAGANVGGIVAAVAILASIPLLAAERWRIVAHACGIACTRRVLYAAHYAGLFAGQLLPAAVGADAVRLALLWRHGAPLQRAIASIVVDRACGVAAILLLVLAGLPFATTVVPEANRTLLAAGLLLAVAGVAAFMLVDRLPDRGPAALRRALDVLRTVRRTAGRIESVLALALGMLLHLAAIAAVFVLLRAFGFAPAFTEFVSIAAFAIFVGMLPLSINGWGVREGAMVVGLARLGIPAEAAFMVSFLYGLGGAVVSLPGCVSWLALRRAVRDQNRGIATSDVSGEIGTR